MLNHVLTSAIFLLIGIEIREGLSHLRAAILPTVSALGGMIAPALIFIALSSHNQPWAVVMPTDVALALGALSLLGSKVNPSVRLFLMTLAVADDFFSLLVMAIFFRHDLDITSAAYTLGAALLGALLPYRSFSLKIFSPVVNYLAVPLYIFTNLFTHINLNSLTSSTSLIITDARVFGKVLGISVTVYLLTKFTSLRLPSTIQYAEIIGVGFLAGMGATVSLVIAEVTITDTRMLSEVRSGLLLSAVISGVLGTLWLRRFPVS